MSGVDLNTRECDGHAVIELRGVRWPRTGGRSDSRQRDDTR
jgi:hypothetical protein